MSFLFSKPMFNRGENEGKGKGMRCPSVPSGAARVCNIADNRANRCTYLF